MANYYWLGKTANGDVNNPENWTLWSPETSQQALPPVSQTIPKYNDKIRFSRYFVSAENKTYPLLGPSGQLNGLCGPDGATALQWLESVKVSENCPVQLGSTRGHYFKFRTSYLELLNGPNGSTFPSYIDLISGTGATKPDTHITSFTSVGYTYNIKGVARNFEIPSFDSLNNPARGSYVFENINFTGVTQTDEQGYLVENPYSIKDTRFSNCKFYFGPNTKYTNEISFSGKNTVIEINKGFTNSGFINLEGFFVQYNLVNGVYESGITGGPSVIFNYENINEPAPRSHFKLRTDSNDKNHPYITINHEVNITEIDLSGGTIEVKPHFSQTDKENSLCKVYAGRMNTRYSRIIGYGSNGPELGTQSRIICRFSPPYDAFEFGGITKNPNLTGDGYPLDINYKDGSARYNIFPIGYTG